ncbi:MAG: ankyrin repeat domain-containing protein [Fuerstiella sp.]
MTKLRSTVLLFLLIGAVAAAHLSDAAVADAAVADTAVANTAVADAAERADAVGVRKLVMAGADVNATQVDGMTALHWAVYHDDADTASLLLQAGAQADTATRYGVTPLALACLNGRAEIVEQLLQAGADANAELDGSETALMTASRTGRLKPVELLLKHGADVQATDWKGQTALMWASAEGHADVVAALLTAGADHTVRLKSGFTPLFFAVREGRTDAAFVLLDAGADINGVMQVQRGGGKAPRNGMSPLVLAVENGHFELAVELLKAGADPDDQRSGYTALHTVTWVRKPDRGDNPEGDPSPLGSGVLDSLQFVRKLVEAGGNVNVRLQRGRSGRGRLNQKGMTPFLMAADTADVPLMQLLLELGADPSITNADGTTALMAAAGIGTLAPEEEAGTEEEALAAVRLLLSLGFDVNATDRNGETAMHGAAYASWPGMAQFLSDHGADIDVWNRENKYGWTPLRIAQGHRPGNFKPAPETIAAIGQIMRKNGVKPTDAKPFRGGDEYRTKPAAKTP